MWCLWVVRVVKVHAEFIASYINRFKMFAANITKTLTTLSSSTFGKGGEGSP